MDVLKNALIHTAVVFAHSRNLIYSLNAQEAHLLPFLNKRRKYSVAMHQFLRKCLFHSLTKLFSKDDIGDTTVSSSEVSSRFILYIYICMLSNAFRCANFISCRYIHYKESRLIHHNYTMHIGYPLDKNVINYSDVV